MGGSGVNYGRPPNQQTYVARRTYIATSVSMIFIIAYLALRISVYLFTRRGPKGERETTYYPFFAFAAREFSN